MEVIKTFTRQNLDSKIMTIAANNQPNSLAQTSPLNLSVVQTTMIVTVMAWIGASVLMDFIIMPGLYFSGMMSDPGFVSAGDMIFSMFNRAELVAGAVVLSGTLLWRAIKPQLPLSKAALLLATILLAIPCIYTYGLTPQMSGLGIQLSLFESVVVPDTMDQLHYVYWSFEVLKLAASGVLLSWLWNRPQSDWA